MIEKNTHHISLVHWLLPKEVLPDEASYILLKQFFDDVGHVCSQAAYKHGAFWHPFPDCVAPRPIESIVGWAYLPYNPRLG